MQEMKTRQQPFAAQIEPGMSDTNALAASMANLQAAHQRLEQVYLDKPRQAHVMDRYAKVRNNSEYALLCANECIEYGTPPYPVIRFLNQTLHQIGKLIDDLKNDKYQCKSQPKIDAWLSLRRTSPTPVRQ